MRFVRTSKGYINLDLVQGVYFIPISSPTPSHVSVVYGAGSPPDLFSGEDADRLLAYLGHLDNSTTQDA